MTRYFILFFTCLICLNSTSKNLFTDNSNYYNECTKELIVIQTLLSENRLTDLSKFLDEYDYISIGENVFSKYTTNTELMKPTFAIKKNDDGSSYLGVIVNSSDSFSNKELRDDLRFIWQEWTSGIRGILGQQYVMFKNFYDAYENKEVGGILPTEYDDVYRKIDRYSYETKTNDKWEVTKASNWSTFSFFSNTEENFVFAFHGPGKLTCIEILMPKHNDVSSDEKVPAFFYIIPRKLSDSDNDKSEMNIDWFMSLDNWNDRIWADND